MKKRYALFGMTALVAISLAVPAFGGPGNPVANTFASAKGTAKKALKAAKAAQTSADNAQTSADKAQNAADKAQTTADGAQTTATQAKTAAATAQTSADQANTAAQAAQATADSKFGTMTLVEGDTSPTDSSTTKNAAAGCNGDEITGGGFVLGGTGANEATTIVNGQYLNGWLVTAKEIGAGTANTWNLTAEVHCIT
jgi:hypothetical protein